MLNPHPPPSRRAQLNLEIEPSQIVALSANSAFGKSTLLRLCERQLIPTSGFVDFPPSWRVRFVDSIPQLSNDTLMANLRLGNKHEHSDDEIWELSAQIGLSSELIGRGDVPVGVSGEKLALSDRICVSIIRALLSSVDLLLLPNVLDSLGQDRALRVMKVLRLLRIQRITSYFEALSPGRRRPRESHS